MTVETKSLNIEVSGDQTSLSEELSQDKSIEKILISVSLSELIDLHKRFESIQDYMTNEYPDVRLDLPEIREYLDSVTTEVSLRFRKNGEGVIEPVFLNGLGSSAESYSLVMTIRCSQQIVAEGEFFIRLGAKEIFNDGQDLQKFVMEKVLEVKDEKDLIKDSESTLVQVKKKIQDQGITFFFKENIIEKLDVGDLSTKIDIDSKEHDTVGKMAVFLFGNYTIPNDLFKSYIEILNNKNIGSLENYEFYENYIMNNEHIFWNPEDSVGGIFNLLESNKIKMVLMDRFKNSMNLKESEKISKDVLMFTSTNNPEFILEYIQDLSRVFDLNYGKYSVSTEMTESMRQLYSSDEPYGFKYSNQGMVVVENSDLAEMVWKLIELNKVNLPEDSISWIFNNCNTDVGSCDYPCFSLKESADPLLLRLIERETCPDFILTGYFSLSSKISKAVINNPRLESNDDLLDTLHLILKKELDNQLDNEELLSVYFELKKFPYLSEKIKGNLGDNLLTYANDLKNSQDASKLDSEWNNVYNYNQKNNNWPYSFKIDNRRAELLTIIAKNEISSMYVINEYKNIFGTADNEYKEAVQNKVSSEDNALIFKELFMSLELEDKMDMLVKRYKLKKIEDDEVISELWSETIINSMKKILNTSSSVGYIMSKSRVFCRDILMDAYPNVIDEVSRELSEDFFNYFKKRAVDSKNPTELDSLVMLIRGEIKDKRQSLVNIGMTYQDDLGRNSILQFVTNNQQYKVGDLSYWVSNPEHRLTNIEKLEDIFSRELSQIKNQSVMLDSEDFDSVAKNIRDLLKLSKEQTDSVQKEIDLIKTEVISIIINKYKIFIEQCSDESILEEKIRYLFELNSMNSIINIESTSVELFKGISSHYRDLEPLAEAFLRNRYAPLALKMNIRSSFWGEEVNAPMSLAV
jgi:hypothetical protein